MDTLFLSKLVNKGFVYGFDIQKEAINNTNKLLLENNINNFKLFNESHENIDITLKDYIGKISLILFNLGYLPNGDKSITTTSKSTLKALKKSFKMLNNKGIILLVIYSHKEGKKEEKEILKYLKDNNIKYNEYRNTSNKEAPYLVEIKKEDFFN